MVHFGDLEAWFVTGSQHLYGPDVLKTVQQHADTIAKAYFNGEFHLYYAFQFSARTLPESLFSPTRRSTRRAPIFTGSITDSFCSPVSKMLRAGRFFAPIAG